MDLGGLSIKGAARTSDDKGKEKEKEKEAAAKPDVPRTALVSRRVGRHSYTWPKSQSPTSLLPPMKSWYVSPLPYACCAIEILLARSLSPTNKLIPTHHFSLSNLSKILDCKKAFDASPQPITQD